MDFSYPAFLQWVYIFIGSDPKTPNDKWGKEKTEKCQEMWAFYIRWHHNNVQLQYPICFPKLMQP